VFDGWVRLWMIRGQGFLVARWGNDREVYVGCGGPVVGVDGLGGKGCGGRDWLRRVEGLHV